MIAKKGMMIKMENQQEFLVDDIKVVQGKEYVVLYSLKHGTFHIATENVVNDNISYNFLSKEESIVVATEIDKIDHGN